jgi:hypothetical protein
MGANLAAFGQFFFHFLIIQRKTGTTATCFGRPRAGLQLPHQLGAVGQCRPRDRPRGCPGPRERPLSRYSTVQPVLALSGDVWMGVALHSLSNSRNSGTI